jgi:putative adhesin
MAAMRHEAFPVDGPVKVVVRAPAGVVEIETADTHEATVELQPKDAGSEKAADDAIVELRPGGRRPELVVDVVHGLRIGGRRGPRLSIVVGRGPSLRIPIRVPQGSSLDVSTESADVVGTGTFESVDVRSASGDVRLQTVEQEASVKSVSGDVLLDAVGGEASVNSVSGDLIVGSIGRVGSLHTVSGDIEVRESLSSLHLKTISGDARVGSASEGEVNMQSVSGDLTLGLRSGSKLWVDARSTSGKTTSELELGDVPPADRNGPLVELRAKSVSGDIRVVRA